MTQLSPMTCACGELIVPRAPQGPVVAATSYETCLYQCGCGRGYSNSSVEANRTCIVCLPELNVPEEVRDGLDLALGMAVNTRNLASKRAKFCFSTSEDAVTWTVFRWLEQAGALSVAAEVTGAAPPEGEPCLLLWGAPTRAACAGLRDELVAVLDSLGEAPTTRSEPDVIVAWPELLIVVEVKYTSGNDVRPDYQHFDRYLDRSDVFAASLEQVRRDGLYELVRNWRFGAQLAERTGRHLALVNLGPASLAARTPSLASTFATSDSRTFTSASWGELFAAARRIAPLPAWLEAYISERGLDGRWS